MGVAKGRGLLKVPPRGIHIVIVPIVSFILSSTYPWCSCSRQCEFQVGSSTESVSSLYLQTTDRFSFPLSPEGVVLWFLVPTSVDELGPEQSDVTIFLGSFVLWSLKLN